MCLLRPVVPGHLGARGERVARRALRRAGYRILATNLATPRGEVDLLALERGVLAVVEVKASARPAEAGARRVRGRQRRRLHAAGRWIRARAGYGHLPLRFDLVLVRFDGRRPIVSIRRGGY